MCEKKRFLFGDFLRRKIWPAFVMRLLSYKWQVFDRIELQALFVLTNLPLSFFADDENMFSDTCTVWRVQTSYLVLQLLDCYLNSLLNAIQRSKTNIEWQWVYYVVCVMHNVNWKAHVSRASIPSHDAYLHFNQTAISLCCFTLFRKIEKFLFFGNYTHWILSPASFEPRNKLHKLLFCGNFVTICA